MPRPERIALGCSRLACVLPPALTDEDVADLGGVARAFHARSGKEMLPAVDLLEDAACRARHPAPLLLSLLEAQDPSIRTRALQLMLRLAHDDVLDIDMGLLSDVAGTLAELAGASEAVPLVRAWGRLAAHGRRSQNVEEVMLDLFVGPAALSVRRLAARRLDLDGLLPAAHLTRRVLGQEVAEILEPYLEYTRASYADILELAVQEAPTALSDSLRRAEAECPARVLEDVAARVGWPGLGRGLDVEVRVAVSFDGAYPVHVRPAEACLLEEAGAVVKAQPFMVVVAHGGTCAPAVDQSGGDASQADLFRRYALRHAELLPEFLDLAPLTEAKMQRMVEAMDRVVQDHVTLFAGISPDVDVLPAMYRELRDRICGSVAEGAPQPSADLTRLVRTFEEPESLAAVRTLHGLKRYLHQSALRLGMRLVASERGTDRTMSVLVYRGESFVGRIPDIRYAVFAGEDVERCGVPYCVTVVADAFTRQLLTGQASFPDVRVFAHGNEVHYYLGFGNHPALLRIHYAPPLRGGMIDLEFFGVSKYDLSVHPDPELRTTVMFFKRLGFDITVDGTRVHARYDKEQALGLGDLCTKAEALFRLAPYLMDLDWTVGALELPVDARAAVGEVWASWFTRWGVLPLSALLTQDRRGVRAGTEPGPTGPKEHAWKGVPPYTIPFDLPARPTAAVAARASAAALGADLPAEGDAAAGEAFGAVVLERSLLAPLREAVSSGLIEVRGGALLRLGEDQVQPDHEAKCFALLLEGRGDLGGALATARLVAPLERSLHFTRSGAVEAFVAERARLDLPGRPMGVYLLRDMNGIARLALYSEGPTPLRQRASPAEPWVTNLSSDARRLALLLRRHDYLASEETDAPLDLAAEARSVRRALREAPLAPPHADTGEPLIQGIMASPGRAVGQLAFGTDGRAPADFAGMILAAPAVTPSDGPFIYRSAGVLTTGGGVLSHAGLLAAQFHKPAITVPGAWRQSSAGTRALALRYRRYRETTARVAGIDVVIREDVTECERVVHEGDLVVIDGPSSRLRVLGAEGMTLTLHRALRSLREAQARLASATEPNAYLTAQGRHLRAVHLLKRLLADLRDPPLARHVVEELLTGTIHGHQRALDVETSLLRILLSNPSVASLGAALLGEVEHATRSRLRMTTARAADCIVDAGSLYEVLALRLQSLRLSRVSAEVRRMMQALALPVEEEPEERASSLDAAARRRIGDLRELALRAVASSSLISPRRRPRPVEPVEVRGRHALTTLERCEALLGTPAGRQEIASTARRSLTSQQRTLGSRLGGRTVVGPMDGGIALAPHIGWKAANLAEIGRITGQQFVPPWFAVSDDAFRTVLATDVPVTRSRRCTLEEAVREVLIDRDMDPPGQAARIRALWEAARLPTEIVDAIVAAYRGLGPGGGHPLRYVAVRSSGRQEDTESASHAGEFETFLFVQGESSVLDHVKRAWCGLWTERAIRTRRQLGDAPGEIGGGVIVQRMLRARVAGVLQTVNVAEENFREIVVNAGFGLGEGVVSGAVGSDQITVLKPGRDRGEPLQLRYMIGDKTEQVVFDERAGRGTVKRDTAYHERLRPALEYVELKELVDLALLLERTYGHPLDLEFAIEGRQLFVLQVRPVPSLLAVFRETIERYPLGSTPQEIST